MWTAYHITSFDLIMILIVVLTSSEKKKKKKKGKFKVSVTIKKSRVTKLCVQIKNKQFILITCKSNKLNSKAVAVWNPFDVLTPIVCSLFFVN